MCSTSVQTLHVLDAFGDENITQYLAPVSIKQYLDPAYCPFKPACSAPQNKFFYYKKLLDLENQIISSVWLGGEAPDTLEKSLGRRRHSTFTSKQFIFLAVSFKQHCKKFLHQTYQNSSSIKTLHNSVCHATFVLSCSRFRHDPGLALSPNPKGL